MRRGDFIIPIYDWKITVAIVESTKDAASIRTLLNSVQGSKDAINETIAHIENSAHDGGDTWRDFSQRRGVILIYPCTSKSLFYEVINHEKRHLVDRILQWANINDFEAAAYLDGYVSKQIFTKFSDLL